jgi:hypothetical protein
LKEDAAAEETGGDHIFSIVNGYEWLIISLLHAIPNHPAVVRLNTLVQRVEWQRGRR